jgi:hypothetical protein
MDMTKRLILYGGFPNVAYETLEKNTPFLFAVSKQTELQL